MFKDQRYEDLLAKYHETVGENAVLKTRLSAADTTLDWFRVRVNQLEHERGQLLFNFLGVKVATPVIERAPEKSVDQRVAEILHQTSHFGDIGETAAKQLGIDWNSDGTLKQKEQ